MKVGILRGNSTDLFIPVLKKIPYKLRRFVTIIHTFKNWPLLLQNRFDLFHNYSKGDELITELRSGIKFYFRFRNGEINSIDDVWCEKIQTKYFGIEDGDVVIDIGANIGAFSIFAAKSSKNVKVFSYEPTPDTFSRLVKNIKINHFENIIHPFQLGIAGKRDKRTLFINPDNSDSNTFYKNFLPNYRNESVQIETITLEDIFKNNNINHCDFLKMDCEGAEYEILFNTSPEYLQKIKKIALEYHCGRKEIIDFLKKTGFSIQHKSASNMQGLIWAENLSR